MLRHIPARHDMDFVQSEYVNAGAVAIARPTLITLPNYELSWAITP
jgi:hypothetical protein